MKIFIVAILSLCAATAFAQQSNQPPPEVGPTLPQAGIAIQHPMPGVARHTSNANGASQETVIASSPAHAVVFSANTKPPVSQQASSASGNESGTVVAMPKASATQAHASQTGTLRAGSIVLRANEKAPAPAVQFQSTTRTTEQK